MNIRNFKIYDNAELDARDIIKDRIEQTERRINHLYPKYNKEVAIEYNFGSIMQHYEISLVIYNNPQFSNNPYVFMYIDTEQYHILLDRADIALFSSFVNERRFYDFLHSLEVGFKNIPKTAFLGEQEIAQARQFAQEYDER